MPGFAYLSDNVQAVAGEKAALEWLSSATWEQARSYAAVVEASSSAVANIRPDAARSSPGSVDVREYTPGHILLHVSAARPALLVVSESWYPGWRAELDSQPVAVLRANYLSQGVITPTGEHTVELEYAPEPFRYGALASGVSVLGVLVLVVWARRTRTQSRQPSAVS